MLQDFILNLEERREEYRCWLPLGELRVLGRDYYSREKISELLGLGPNSNLKPEEGRNILTFGIGLIRLAGSRLITKEETQNLLIERAELFMLDAFDSGVGAYWHVSTRDDYRYFKRCTQVWHERETWKRYRFKP